jgi:hypothetical protein
MTGGKMNSKALNIGTPAARSEADDRGRMQSILEIGQKKRV